MQSVNKICPICNKALLSTAHRNAKYCPGCRKEAHRLFSIQYRKDHKIDGKKLREYQFNFRKRSKRNTFEAYGGCLCKDCGISDFDVLTIDHVNGGGTKERRVRQADGMEIYRRLKREGFPPGFEVVCRNCNWKRHLKNIVYMDYDNDKTI